MENEKTQSLPDNSTHYQPMSIGNWIATSLICAIPIVGFIMLFVWAFGGNTQPSKANWAKATLIIIGISIVICFLFLAIFFGSLTSTLFSKTKTGTSSKNVIESVQKSTKSDGDRLEVRNRRRTAYDGRKTAKTGNLSSSTTYNEECYAEVCLELRNHDPSNQSFEIYMINSVPVAGFQCDLPGIDITGSGGGILQENGYQTSNSAVRILSFSMQAQLIPIGEEVLTTIYYSKPGEEVCMTGIIFAGIGGAKLSNNEPECMRLN